MMWIDDRRSALEELPKERLIDDQLNGELNRLVGRLADYGDDESDPYGHGKRVPYIGWYWRHVDFAGGNYYVGHCGEFVGFMENNKWGYPERQLTPTEADRVTEIVCAAKILDGKGGVVSEIEANTKAKIHELWDLLQSFPMTVEGFWIFGPQGRIGFADTEEEADQMCDSLSSAGGGISYRKVAASAS